MLALHGRSASLADRRARLVAAIALSVARPRDRVDTRVFHAERASTAGVGTECALARGMARRRLGVITVPVVGNARRKHRFSRPPPVDRTPGLTRERIGLERLNLEVRKI